MSVTISPLLKMTQTTRTEYWSDTCNTDELSYALGHGATGATTNPVIVGAVLKQQIKLWDRKIAAAVKSLTDASEIDIAWKMIEDVALAGAEMLLPVYEKTGGLKGRIAIQIDPKYFRNPRKMVEHALHLHGLAKNVTVKLPATSAGMAAIEEATYQGVSVTSTVSFTVPQVVEAAEAVERGLNRRTKEGKPIDFIHPIAVVMVGRTDDWLKVVAGKKDMAVNPEILEWPGVAVLKRAYGIFKERKYRSTLMSAAFRNHYHWSEFIGGDLITTITYQWAKRINDSDIEVVDRINKPVDPAIVADLRKYFVDFRRAYEPGGMKSAEFDSFGSTARTMRAFIESYDGLLSMIRDYILPDPDK